MQDGIDDVEAGAIRWINNIRTAEVASSAVSLGWVQDGIDAVEVKTIEELSYVANRDAGIGLSLVSLGWVQDGINDVEAEAFRWMRNMIIGSVEVALSAVSLGWVQDGLDAMEVKTIERLSYIANRHAGVGLSLVSTDWAQDGIDDVEAEAFRWMNNIRTAEVALSVVSLGWLQDGVEALEVEAIEDLSYMANRDAGIGLSIVSLGWVQDGINDVEAEAFRWMRNMIIGSVEVALSAVSLGWVQDGLDAMEVKTIERLSYIANRHAGVGLSLVSTDWAQDGIDDVEAEAFRWMNNIRTAEVALSAVSLGWVQDDIDAVEVKAIENLSYVANKDTGVGLSVVSLGWVQDDTNDAEADLIRDFASIADKDAGAALRIVGMPFIETIEPPDISALTSLRLLAAFMPDMFVRVMSHSALLDGISDNMAPVVATLHGVAGTNPGLIDILLDPTQVSLKHRVITLPLTGEVVLFIIRTAPGAARSMDLLEHSVRGAEEFMGVPLPTRYVGLLFENAVSGSNAGTNFGTHIAILPKFDVDDDSNEASFAGHANAHEVAHYYWGGNENWVDEGAADFMASIIEGARTGRPIGVTNLPCVHARNIAELEGLGIAQGDAAFRCNYSLGERLFVDLHRTLGYERFRQGFRALYLASEIEDDADRMRGMSVGIEHVREAFRSDDGGEAAAIGRWYDGSEPYDLSQLDASIADPSLPKINGRIDRAYITIGEGGPEASSFSVQDVRGYVLLNVEYSYSVKGGPYDISLDLVEVYEDGFEFRRGSLQKITATDQYIGGTRLAWVGQPERWAAGRYWVYVYAGDQKVAEVQYEVTP